MIIMILLIKIDEDKELNKILKSLNNIGMNFYLEKNGTKIYPLLTDLLEDVITLEYAWQADKELIQAIITE